MPIPLLNALERMPAYRARALRGVRIRGRVESSSLIWNWRWCNKFRMVVLRTVISLHQGYLQRRRHKSRKAGAFYEVDVLLPGQGRVVVAAQVDSDSIPC